MFGDIDPPKRTKVTLQHLKYSVEEDLQFLNELESLKVLSNQVKPNK